MNDTNEVVTVFAGWLFTLTTKLLPSGVNREHVDARNGVSVLPILDNGCIRMVEKEININGDPLILPISGYIEDNETPLECAKRELLEESSLLASDWNLFLKSELEGGIDKTQYIYIAREVHAFNGEVETDPNEVIVAMHDYSLEELREMIKRHAFGTSNIGYAIRDFVDGLT